MKKLILIVLLAACGNPKADIVEKQKKLKNEIVKAQAAAFLFKQDATEIQLKNHRAFMNTGNTGYMDSVYRLTDSADAYNLKKSVLQDQYDSLEMELKKY